jgi:hypothetical protein
MDTKVILLIGLTGGYAITHVGLGADVPGKPLTVMANVVVTSSTTSATTIAMIPNMGNPYGSDFALPPNDVRLGKITVK